MIIMIKYNKFFVLFFVLLFLFMSFCVASNSNDTCHKVVKKTDKVSHDLIKKSSDNKRSSLKDIKARNVNVEKNNSLKIIDKKVESIKSSNFSRVNNSVVRKSKTSSVVEVDVGEDNFKQYFRVFGHSIIMGSKITSDTGNLSLNLKYLPDGIDSLDFSATGSSFLNRSLTIDAGSLSFTNVALDVSSNFGNLTLKNFNLTFNEDYNGHDYVTVSGDDTDKVLYNLSINMNKSGVSDSKVLDINSKVRVENSVVNARLVETAIDWGNTNLPPNMGVSIKGYGCEFYNNTFNITSSGAYESMVSIYGIYYQAGNLKFVDNVVYLNNVTGYAYAFDNRGLDALIARNKFFVDSWTYANAITCEMMNVRNCIIRDNYVNVSAGWDLSPWGNLCVAYGIQVLEMSYNGNIYTSSGLHPRNNSFINNTIVGSAGQIYGFEIWGSITSSIIGNHINITGRTPMGMGIIGAIINVSDNDIIINGEHNHTESTVDYLTSRATGMLLALSKENITLNNNTIRANNCMGLYLYKGLSDLIAENNTIVSVNHDYAIDLTEAGSNIVIRYNKLNGRNHKADNSVITNTSQSNLVEDNTCYLVSQIRVISQNSVDIKDKVQIVVVLKEDTNQPIINTPFILSIDGEEVLETTDEYGMYLYNYTPDNTGIKEITATYKDNEIYLGSIMTTLINVTDKDSIINQLTDTIQEQEETIQEQEQQINNKNTTITQKQSEIKQKQQQTQTLNNTVNQLQEELKDTNNKINNTNNNNQNGTTKTKSDLTITITPYKKTLKAGQKVTLNIKMTDKKTNKAVTSATLNIKIGSKTVKATVKNGVAKVTYTVPRGCDAQTVKVSTSYSSDKYNKQTANTQFKVTKTTPTLKKTSITYKNKKTTIKATIKDATKKLLNKNVKVTVKIDGKAILKNKEIKNGKISLSFKKALKKGNHKIVITSASTKAFNKATLKTIFKV